MKKFYLSIVLFVFLALPVFSSGTLENTYVWNDGPWITAGAESGSYTVSWTTSLAKESVLYLGQSMYDMPEKYKTDKSHLHQIVLKNLKPGMYYYVIDENFTNFESGHVFSLKVDVPDDENVRIAVMGDMQPKSVLSSKMCRLVSAAVERENPDAVIQMGDIVQMPDFNSFWHYTFKAISLFSGNRPLYVIAGNHEAIQGNNKNYRKLFPAPFQDEKGAYYSYDIGPAHFVSMDFCDAGYEKVSDKQKVWVEQDIINAKARGRKWIFILFHGNIVDTHPLSRAVDVQRWIIPLADKYGVDGILFGHSHGYQHWLYEYGHDGLLYSSDDKPSGRPLPLWCIAGGGAALRVDYGLLDVTSRSKAKYYNTATREYEIHDIVQNKWNRKVFIDHTDDPFFGQVRFGKHYYHNPALENYCSDNEHFGFVYGEQTEHYMIMDFEGDVCKISIHYHNGTLLTGPEDSLPQQWIYSKKDGFKVVPLEKPAEVEDIVSGDTASEDVIPADTSSEDVTPEDAVTSDVPPEEVVQ